MENNSRYFDESFKEYDKLSLPLAIQIEITELCNLKCPFCYNDSGNRCGETFSIEKWKKFLYQLKALGGVFQCAFSGGEPLLYKNQLLELLDILHSDHTGLILITNGYYLDEPYIEKLRKYDWYWIQVSLDSYISDAHDSLRGLKGSFERATTAIRQLKSRGLPVAISSVICNKNINDIDGLVQLGCQLQADVILFSPVLPIGRTLSNSSLQLNTTQEQVYDREIKEVTEKYSSQILVRSAQPYEEQIKKVNSLPPFGLLIRPNGDVKVDCLSQEIIGNVFETSIKAVWERIVEERRKTYEQKELSQTSRDGCQQNEASAVDSIGRSKGYSGNAIES